MRLATLLTAIPAAALIAVSCGKIDDRISSLEERISILEDSEINSIDSQISSIKATMEDMQKAGNALQNYISDLEQKDADLSDQISETNKEIDALQTKLHAELASAGEELRKELDAAGEELSGDIADAKNQTAVAKAEVIAQLEAYKALMNDELKTVGGTLSSLKEQSGALETNLENLQEYVDAEIGAARDWAGATFATIGKQDTLATTVAAIETDLEALDTYVQNLETRLEAKTAELSESLETLDNDTQKQIEELTNRFNNSVSKLKKDLTQAYTSLVAQQIIELETSLKSWVNNQLSAYYDAEQVQGKLDALKSDLLLTLNTEKAYLKGLTSALESATADSLSQHTALIGALSSRIGTAEGNIEQLKRDVKANTTAIDNLQTALTEAKTQIAKDYAAAIQSAISAYDGTVTAKIAESIATVNSTISSLSSSLTTLQREVRELSDKVSEIENVVNNLTGISYIPTYSDYAERVSWSRSALKVVPANISLKFDVLPSSAAAAIASDWKSLISAQAVYTKTKSAGGDLVALTVTGASASNGVLTVNISPAGLDKNFVIGNLEASVVVKISSDNRTIISDYIKLTPGGSELAFVTYLLKNFDTDGDCTLDTDALAKAKTLNVSGMGVKNLGGLLENMPALETLDCSNNNLGSLNVTQNTNLKNLNCSNNKFNSLNLSKNTKLESLNISNLSYNENYRLQSLDLTAITQLKSLTLKSNYYLGKVICSSEEWIGNVALNVDPSVFFYVSGNTSTWIPVGIDIDGLKWCTVNAGASTGNLAGSYYTLDKALTACPTGWRLPTKAELESLVKHSSSQKKNEFSYTLYNWGRWFSGSSEYSATAVSVFFPGPDYNNGGAWYWSSNVYEGNSTANWTLLFYNSYIKMSPKYKSDSMIRARCVKDIS